MVYRTVLGIYAEYFCFLFCTQIAQIERYKFDKHLVHLG